jgi:hypothetical protein
MYVVRRAHHTHEVQRCHQCGQILRYVSMSTSKMSTSKISKNETVDVFDPLHFISLTPTDRPPRYYGKLSREKVSPEKVSPKNCRLPNCRLRQIVAGKLLPFYNIGPRKNRTSPAKKLSPFYNRTLPAKNCRQKM